MEIKYETGVADWVESQTINLDRRATWALIYWYKISRVLTLAVRQEWEQKRQAQEGKLQVKRQEVDTAKVRVDFPFAFSLFWCW